MDHEGLESAQADLRGAAKALMLLHSEMAQRETRLSASFNQQAQSLRQEVLQFRSDIAGIAGGASTQIAKEAKNAASLAAAQYDRDVSAFSAQLHRANKMAWMWSGAAGAILLLVLFVGWVVLGYYRRELSAAKAELQRYEDAIPVVRAFHASDARLCEERICINVDPNGRRLGDQRQYRQAKPRANN